MLPVHRLKHKKVTHNLRLELQCFLHRNGTALDLCTWVLVALGSARITTHKRGPSSLAHEQTLVMWRSRFTECVA